MTTPVQTPKGIRQAINDEVERLGREAAGALRRGLPRVYGDPLRVARDWPSA